MSHSRFLLAAVVVMAGLAVSPVSAQYRPYVAIEDARIGFRPGQFVSERDSAGSAGVAKRERWAPISFKLKVIRKLDPGVRLPMKLRVEGRDADETRFTAYFKLGEPLNDRPPPPTDPTGRDTTRAVNEMIQSAELPLRACVRPGGTGGDVTLTILTDIPNEAPSEVSDSVKVNGLLMRDPNAYFVVSLGSNLAGFDLAGNNDFGGGRAGGRGGLRGGRVETGVIDSVAEMPDHWFAYEGADLVVLPTANSGQDFLADLFDPQKAGPNTLGARKREALMEWVRRGGKLLISVGQEANRLKQYPALFESEVLPVRLTGREDLNRLELVYPTATGGQTLTATLSWTRIDTKVVKEDGKEKKIETPVPNAPFAVAKFEPNPNRTTIILHRDKSRGEPGVLAAVQCPVGMGRVTALAFDLDAAPFSTLDRGVRQQVWDWLLRAAGSEKAAEATNERDRGGNTSSLSPVNFEDGALSAIRREIDEFEGVPVISFGWVALFILLYTLLVGPIEYLFLKKILGRLELTWITFPIIVLSVSAAAYFTAYAIKGKDLRINKIDLVDIDVASKRVYGKAWFSVFSPRVDSYTVGIEPKAPWAAEGKAGSMTDWVGAPRAGSSGSGGFRTYQYELDGTGTNTSGMVSVPIQVWSTKTFTGDWSAPFDPAAPPITADIRHPKANPAAASGEITSNLPFGNFQEGFIFFAGAAYPLKPMPVGQPVRFDSMSTPEANWETKVNLFDGKFRQDESIDVGGRVVNRPGQVQNFNVGGPLSLWGVLLADRAARQSGTAGQNASLRMLDQSWRLNRNNTEEVIIIAKLAREPKPVVAGQQNAEPPPTAEQLMSDPASSSPTKLWLRGLPGSGPRAEVPGILRQDTYVRIVIPVKPAGAK